MTESTPHRFTVVKLGLLGIFVAIHISYYVSALETNHLKAFFPQGTIQNQKTLDYYQVPNGAESYFEGGSILGRRRDFPVLPNVYHPAFTLTVGGVLQLWDQEAGFRVYAFAKLIATILLAILVFWRYRCSEHFLAAAFVFFCFFSQAVEIGTGQYHFLLNTSVFLILLFPVHRRYDWMRSGCYLVSLLVKPIGLLWIPTFLVNKQYRATFWALGLYVALTLIFTLDVQSQGDFYLRNIFVRTNDFFIVDEPTYTINWILSSLNFGTTALRAAKYSAGFALLIYTLVVRPSIFTGTFLWTSYYLLFYIWVFEYHYTSLIPFYALGLLTRPEFQRPWVRVSILLSCFPSPYLLLNRFDLFQGTEELNPDGLFLVVCWKVVPLLIVVASVAIEAIQVRRLGAETDLKSEAG